MITAAEKCATRYETRRLIRRGEIHRSTSCERCGRESSLQVHHRDYANPRDVAWLCRRCHRRAHTVEPISTTHIYRFIAEWRETRGFTQKQLASAVGVRQAAISDVETGKAKMLRLALLDDMARVLNTEPHLLLQPPRIA